MADADSLKVVHVPRRFAADYWGGTESVVLSYCQELQRLGHDQSIFTTQALDPTPHSQIQGVDIHRYSYFYPYLGLGQAQKDLLDRKGGNLFSWSLGWSLWRQPKLNLIHLHTGKRLGGIARWVAQRRRIPYVLSLHGGVYDVPGAEAASWTEPTQGHWEWGRLLGWLVGSRRVLDDASLVLCLGQKEQQLLQQQHPRTRVEVFPNGVDAARFGQGDRQTWRDRCQLGEDDRLLLCVGRIDPQKNQALALQILARLPQNYHLLLLGACTNDGYLQQLRGLTSELGLNQRVHGWHGASGQELVDAYHGCDLFLLPSLHEPFGIVVLEAWAAGKAVIASAVGGLLDLVEDGRHGWLFPPGNLEAALRLIEQAAANPEQTAQVGQQARAHCAQHFAWSALAPRLVHLYREVLRAHPDRQ